MLLCDVALGTCDNTNQNLYATTATGPTPCGDCNTLVAPSNQWLDSRFTATVQEGPKAISIPLGRPSTASGANAYGGGQFTEYIVNDCKQIVIKYLVKFWRS